MSEVYRMKKGYGALSAGTKVVLLSTDEKIGTARVKTLSHSGITMQVDNVPLDHMEIAKSRSEIVPAINSRERRRKVKKTMREMKGG